MRRSDEVAINDDRRILQRIADALDITPGDTVIEIGPGRGSLTAFLEPCASRLLLIEYDRALAARPDSLSPRLGTPLR